MSSIVYSILFTMLDKRRVSRSFLSEKYEISKRTVSRYVDTLVESGIPVLSAPGKNGGYMLPDDYTLERAFLTETERKRLLAALRDTAKNYPDKINSDLIDKLNSQKGYSSDMLFSQEHLIIDAGPWGSPHIYKNKIDTINKAIATKTTLLIKYVDRHETHSQRLFDPYNMVLKQGVWYVYGWCRQREDYRLFKLSRISYMVLSGKPFEFRPDADVHEKLRGQFDSYDRIDIVVEFTSLILAQIEEWLGIEAVYEEGLNYRAAATVYGGGELVAKILSFGSSIKVISPAFLREEVLIECRRVIANC